MKPHEKKYLKDYSPPDYLVDHIDLRFDIFEKKTIVTSAMEITRNRKTANEKTPLILDAVDLDIKSVVADDMVLMPEEYETGKHYFKLNRVPENFTLEITTCLNPEANTTMEGLYRSGNCFCTQCEAEGFRKITCFPDRPDVMTKFSCIITADQTKYPVLLSNGNMVLKGNLENNRHFVKWEDPVKKPCYLFAVVAGDLSCVEDVYTTASQRRIFLKIYVEKENIDKCRYALTSLKQAMAWDEEKFGREYDLDLYQIVAVSHFNMGAMENKGLNVFNARYVLASPETATDTDFMNIQSVIGHEYFHNWTGNRITLKNWFQLSLKEGLTVFRDQEFSSDMNARGVKRIEDVKKLRTHQFPEDAGPMAHSVRPESYIEMNNFYTATVYQKGAEIIRMLSQILGKQGFRKGMDLYFEKFDGCAVTTEDFITTMEEVSGLDLSQFRRWYTTPGTPEVSIKRTYSPENRQLVIDFQQLNYDNQFKHLHPPCHIPVKTGLIDKNGQDITPASQSLYHLKNETDQLVFENILPGTLTSLFREFSAPVKLKTDFTIQELAFLLEHDNDDFNRWDAAQQLFFREIKTIFFNIKNNQPCKLSLPVQTAFGALLANADNKKALIARILALPEEDEIGETFETIDVNLIHKARMFVKKSLAAALKDQFISTLSNCCRYSPSDLSSKAMAERSLKLVCLSYTGALNTDEATEIIYQHFLASKNMTDEIGALSILANITSPKTQNALDQFYDKWKHEPLVIDKWFAVQAASILPDTMDRVEALSRHRNFSMENPNRIRALTGVFSTQNPVNFHRSDGRGYRFLSDQILALDPKNPQISARLASGFSQWKRYDVKRQALMENELDRIIKTPLLSKDTYEIVTKALAGGHQGISE